MIASGRKEHQLYVGQNLRSPNAKRCQQFLNGLISSHQQYERWWLEPTPLENMCHIESFPQVGVKIEKTFETTT